MAEPEDLVSAVLWVANHLHDPEEPMMLAGLRRTMWTLVKRDEKLFFSKYLDKALEYRKKEKVAGRDAVQAQKLEEADIDRLEGRLASFMTKDRPRIFCEKCWRELEQTGELGPVTVVHKK